jgi:NADPH-dependent curcumin reductase CurA
LKAAAATLQGVDLIWESVGGDMFTTCTRALAQGGRLVLIGMMSQYSDGWAPSQVPQPLASPRPSQH